MNDVQYFLWLAQQAFSGLVFAWPLTVATFLLVIVAAGFRFNRRQQAKARLAWLIGPVAIPAVILLWGTVFRETGQSGRELAWQVQTIYVLLFAQLLAAGIATWCAKIFRFLVFAVSIFVTHYCFWSAFVAAMSVTNDWL